MYILCLYILSLFFFRIRNRRSVASNYINFILSNVVVISNHTTEVVSSKETDLLALEVPFYVVLPSDAERAPYRETDYVVPRATLSEIVSQDGAVIEAVVRNKLSPPLTQSVQHVPNLWQDAGIVFSVVTSILIFAVVLAAVIKAVQFFKAK